MCSQVARYDWRIGAQGGADINRPDGYGQTYVHLSYGDTDTATWLLEAGIDINAVGFASRATALGLVAMDGDTASVKFLLEGGADPTIPKEHEWAQPRELAERAEKWGAELVIRTHLVRQQLAIDLKSLLGPDSNLIHFTAHNSEEEIVWLLLEAGADIEAEHPFRGGKPLLWAMEGNVKIMKWLIDRGADVNSRVVFDNERNGMTPLIYCAWWCGDCNECIANADLLIDSGADLKARDAEGKSAVERACQQGHDKLAKALEARGCE